jgi:glutamyl/glutaminyl-tRNA synthetase
LGHARTFWVAHQRARASSGTLIFRNEDLDQQRSRPEFVAAMAEDLHWLGLNWDEGPEIGGLFGPYLQSRRRSFYLQAWRKLRDGGFIYPCTCSRKELERALSAPHETVHSAEGARHAVPPDDEAPYPGTCRGKLQTARSYDAPDGVSWRFRVPDTQTISFNDANFGQQQYVAGRDFADFLIWRRDDFPAYQLAVVVDDEAMQISEVVRGADLLRSTARQLLLIAALGYPPPSYFHCPLLHDANNLRLAKRHDSLSLRRLRREGVNPDELRQRFAREISWDKNLVVHS